MQPVFCALCPPQVPAPPLSPSPCASGKSTRPARKALTKAHRDVLCRRTGSAAPERRNPGNSVPFPACPSEPSRSFPPFAQHALQARRGAFALLRYPLPVEQDGQSRRRTACGELLRIKQKGRRFRLPVGCSMVGIRVPSAEREAAGAFPAPLPALRRGNLCLRCSPGTDNDAEAPAVQP